uniref:Phosphatidylinositol-4,5-bisphosphate 4-phosphatase n=1 Tax=Globodera rostochiensis TaxID=31243 RepID=A0A914H297_GLORO
MSLHKDLWEGGQAVRERDNGQTVGISDGEGELGRQSSSSAAETTHSLLSPSPPPSSSSLSLRAKMASDGQRQDQLQSVSQERSPPSAGIYYTAAANQLQQHYPQHVHFDMNSSSPPNSNQFNTNSQHEFHDNETFDGSEDTPAQVGGPSVTCRVCETEIPIEGRSSQHVVRCLQCNEVTPIRAAPPGRKYVRCPCNCLLVCKATSTRIACPRQNCRRVITLVNGPPNSGVPGTAIRAPVGTCRVQCAYCQDIFIKSSSVGAGYTRSRSLLYCVILLVSSLFLIGVIVAIAHGNNSFFMYAFMAILLFACAFLAQRFVFYARIKVSQVLGPL